MNNRFLELYDLENKPIFEEDECIITLENKTFGATKFGEKIKKINPKELIIKFNNNKKELKISITITFKMKDGTLLTNEKYCELTDKNLNDYLKKKNKIKEGVYKIESTDPMFISYVTYERILKKETEKREPLIEKDDELLIKIKKNEFKINEKIFFERNKKIEDYFKFYIQKNNIDNFNGVILEISRYRHFRWGIKIYFCNKEYQPCIEVYKQLKPEYAIKKTNLVNKISKLRHSMPHEEAEKSIEIKKLKNEIKNFDKKECYVKEMDNDIFMGVGKDKEIFEFLITNTKFKRL